VHHPLQPFDARNVEPGALIPGKPFSFDTTVLRAAQAASADREDRPAFVSGPLPGAAPSGDVGLADLLMFFKDPVKGFFRALDFTFLADVEGVEDAMPVEIDNLQEWTVGDRMLNDILRGMSPDRARQAEWCRGTLPPGTLGWRKATEIRDQAALLAAEALPLRTDPVRAIDVNLDIGGGRRLTGTVSPVFGTRLVAATYSRLDGKHLLAAWIPLLALIAYVPERDWSAVCIGRPKRGTRPRREHLGTPQAPALDLLADLVAIYDAGRREPLPLPLKTSLAWAEARHDGSDPVDAASRRWRSGMFPGDDRQPAHVQAWGAGVTLSDLMAPLRPGEEHPGENNRLGAYSARLWLPMLRAGQGER
jgi:exodeoxyribonuclease V gamma subunit